MRLLTLYFFIFVTSTGSTWGHAALPSSKQRPNLIVVVVDDLRWDEYGAAGHPFLQTPNIDRLANEGAKFTSAYAVSPLCSPNRASILTGQYISRHGIVDNIARDQSSHRLALFAKELKRSGYETAHIGKWHMGNDATPRPGYDYWVSYAGQGRSVNPILYENGGSSEVKGYITDLLTDRAIEFIKQKRDKPFFLYLAHKAIHPEIKQFDDSSIDFTYPLKYIAAPRHRGIYKDAVYPRRKNFKLSEEQLAAKPVLADIHRNKNRLKEDKRWTHRLDMGTSEETIRDRSEMLLAVDDGLGRIFDILQKQGTLENTVILLTSDNGYYYGEQGGLSIERRLPYEETVRLPFLIRYPKLIKPGKEYQQFVLSIDIAPTLLDLGKAQIGSHIQGKSLVPLLLDAETDWRNSFLIEYVGYEKPMPWLIDTSYKVIRKNQYKYIHWIQRKNADELYNLINDPYEMNNLITDPKYSEIAQKLREELARLLAESIGL